MRKSRRQLRPQTSPLKMKHRQKMSRLVAVRVVPGSLNQKTLESMAQAEEDCRKVEALGLKLEEPVKLKLGRPKGAWNQKRIYREVAKLVEAAQRGGVEGWRANGRTPQRAQERKALEKEAGEKVMVLMQAEQERLQRDENDV